MTLQTQAAVLWETGQPLRMLSLTVPGLQRGQVLVEMAYSGVCHTQILEARGKRGPDRFLPHTLGHEGSGIVIQTGEGVQKVKAGDRVVVSWLKGQGIDVASTAYESEMGRINSGAVSTFMDHTVTCENRLFRIPDNFPLREAALLGCAIPTGAGIIRNTAKVQPGQSVAIFGCGGIGLSAIAAARAMRANPIIAIDIFDRKLAQARALGATDTIHAREQNAVQTVMHRTNQRGVDYAIEAAGKRETMEWAFQSVRNGGGLCVLAGNLPQGERISLDPFDLIRGKRIVGTWGGETRPDEDIPQYVDWVEQGKLNLAPLISHEYELHDINRALEDVEKGDVARAVLKLGKVAG